MARQDSYVRYTIRIPEPLYEQIKTAAGDKSVNAEIISRLEASLNPKPVNDTNLRELVVAAIDNVVDEALASDDMVETMEARRRAAYEAWVKAKLEQAEAASSDDLDEVTEAEPSAPTQVELDWTRPGAGADFILEDAQGNRVIVQVKKTISPGMKRYWGDVAERRKFRRAFKSAEQNASSHDDDDSRGPTRVNLPKSRYPRAEVHTMPKPDPNIRLRDPDAPHPVRRTAASTIKPSLDTFKGGGSNEPRSEPKPTKILRSSKPRKPD